jgi:hypothetical protein
MSSKFQFPDVAKLTTRDECARAFCSLVARLITHLIKHITDHDCLDILDEIQGKYRLARDTAFTNEQIIERMGHTLLKWSLPIKNHDERFFLQSSLDSLISDAVTKESEPPSVAINDKNRELLARALTPNLRTILFDVLNVMIIIYAKYSVMN